MPWLLVEGQRKMLADFAVVIGVIFALGTWQNRQLPDVPHVGAMVSKSLFKLSTEFAVGVIRSIMVIA